MIIIFNLLHDPNRCTCHGVVSMPREVMKTPLIMPNHSPRTYTLYLSVFPGPLCYTSNSPCQMYSSDHHPHRLSHKARQIHRPQPASRRRLMLRSIIGRIRPILQIQPAHIAPLDAACRNRLVSKSVLCI